MGGQMNNPNALLYKWLVVNSFAALLVYVAWLRDWIALVVDSDASYLSIVIGLVFIVFWMTSSIQIISINREISAFAAGAKSDTKACAAVAAKTSAEAAANNPAILVTLINPSSQIGIFYGAGDVTRLSRT